ncbi:MAG: acyl-CoA dehydrogenase family protein [Burkholderiaceae bacterium]|nr:acyl-CoA dehydrogenase family protein [Burkholderiaceae bacterium]
MSEDQRLIGHSVQRLFAERVDKAARERVEAGAFDDALWQRVVDNGFTRALATEEAGGIAATWSAAVPILHGIGYWQVPLPVPETMVAHLLLSLAGVEAPAGPIVLIEQGCGNTLRLIGGGSEPRLEGTVPHVAWARHAPTALVSSSERQLALVDLRQAAVRCEPHLDHARMPSDTLRFDGARCIAQAASPLALAQPVWTLGALTRALMVVGALESALEQSVRYATERVQFGKPIGRNQAIQQQLALMAGDTAAARMAALAAAADAPSVTARDAPAAPFSIAAAKVRAGEAATRAAGIAHQVHGAIGFTREHPLHFATRRLWAWRGQFGSDAWWAQALGRAAIAGGAAAFWPSLTRRRFDRAFDTLGP